jgi:hypothetical protein
MIPIRIVGQAPRLPPHNQSAANRTHLELKRLAFLWAQEKNGYPIAALEVTLPQLSYRADVAAYRPQRDGTLGHTVVFECKQSAPDLRRDDRRSPPTLARLESLLSPASNLENICGSIIQLCAPAKPFFPNGTPTIFATLEHRGYRE